MVHRPITLNRLIRLGYRFNTKLTSQRIDIQRTPQCGGNGDARDLLRSCDEDDTPNSSMLPHRLYHDGPTHADTIHSWPVCAQAASSDNTTDATLGWLSESGPVIENHSPIRGHQSQGVNSERLQ